jgi:branched-chain amino acid transport system substrate-binding protein
MKNRRFQSFLPAILMAALLVCFTGCKKSSDAGTSAAADTIKVGEFASLTGSEATFGQSSHKGTALAVDAINAAGGVLGKKIDLHTEDNQSQAGQSATAVRKLISSDGVVAILGEVASSRSMEAAPICQESKIPMISPSSTNPKVTETGDYIFRVCFIDPFQGTVMANFGHNTLKLNTAAILSDVKSDYSMGLAKFFKEGFGGRENRGRGELQRRGQGFQRAAHGHQGGEPGWDFRTGLLHGGWIDLIAGPTTRHHGADVRRRRLGIVRAGAHRRHFAGR